VCVCVCVCTYTSFGKDRCVHCTYYNSEVYSIRHYNYGILQWARDTHFKLTCDTHHRGICTYKCVFGDTYVSGTARQIAVNIPKRRNSLPINKTLEFS
jgi:hypothetical protein